MSTFSLILPGRDPSSTPPAATDEAMSSTPSDLNGLRRLLDGIDDRLQDLLIERAAIVSKIGATKKGGNLAAFQPAREAEIIRRLVRRHHGAFPVANLVRMWREMLAATVSLQSPFSVAVLAPSDRPGFWDLARDHYGSNTPMAACDTAGQVIRAVAGGEASIGVLPVPRAGEPDPWWPRLASTDENTPRVMARLPFYAHGNGRGASAEALAIGRGMHQESGSDRTLLAVECAPETSHARIRAALAAPGLVCTFFASAGNGRSSVNLIEVDGFVPASDARLQKFCAELGTALRRLTPIGGYPVPLNAAPPAAKD